MKKLQELEQQRALLQEKASRAKTLFKSLSADLVRLESEIAVMRQDVDAPDKKPRENMVLNKRVLNVEGPILIEPMSQIRIG